MTSFLSVLFTSLMPYFAQAVATALGLISIWALKKLGDKFAVDIQGSLNATVWQGAQQAVAYAEEWANKQIKFDPTTLPSGAAKLQVALGFLTSTVNSQHLDSYGQSKLTSILEAALHVTRPDLTPVVAAVSAVAAVAK